MSVCMERAVDYACNDWLKNNNVSFYLLFSIALKTGRSIMCLIWPFVNLFWPLNDFD